MRRTVSALCLLAFAAFAQTHGQIADYALLLTDAPVAQTSHSRLVLESTDVRSRIQALRNAQESVLAELRRQQVPVRGASQIVLNAIFVSTTRERAAQLKSIPGVAHVVPAPPVKRELDQALNLGNVSGAWSDAAIGGAGNAGARVKIAIVDTGIDQNHPGFQDPSLPMPAGFPQGDSNYTNNKVIVARSYVEMDGYTGNSTPDDTTPRDRVGHGTAIAMIAAGTQNTGPLATIQGVAPKAYLGNYKVFGSPSVNDYARAPAIAAALEDAIADHMDVVALSLGEGDAAEFGPLDVDPAYCPDNNGLPCDAYGLMVTNAVNAGLVVVVAAGNDGDLGVLPHTLSTIHTPGIVPAAITVGATFNAHLLYNAVHIGGSGVPSSLQNLNALFSDGPQKALAPARLIDVTALQSDGLACSALPANSLAGSVALIQRGTCTFSDKINNAQAAGAVGVVLYMQAGSDPIVRPNDAQNTAIPAAMISYSDGVNVKSFLASHTATAALDLALSTSSHQPNTMWPSSSRGPSIGTFAYNPDSQHIYQTYVVKPELVAVGAGIYTATQKLDPNGNTYNPSGYAGVSGTSYAVPMVAGAVALVKQKHPSWTPAQLKSAVTNTATPDVTETDGSAAGIDAMGAGRLNAGNAMNVAATLDPATIEFGVLNTTTVSNSITLNVTNVSGGSATFTFAVQPSTTSSVTTAATVSVSPATLTLTAGQTNSFSVNLRGSLPAAGSYEGFIVVTGGPGGSATLRVPYQFLVTNTTVADVFPDANGGFIDNPGDKDFPVQVRAIDKFGIPIIGAPVQWLAGVGGGAIDNNLSDKQTFRYGAATGFLNMGTQPGLQVFTATVGGVTAEFDGYARPYPVIPAGNVSDGASYTSDHGLAPGSYIQIKGTDLSDTTQVYATNYLPVALSDISVSFDGGGLSLPGHLHFVSPGQINVQVPWEFQGQSSVSLKVDVTGNRWFFLQSAPYTVPLAPYAPAFFLNGNSIADAVDGVNCPAPYIIGASCAALRGQPIALYANGLGPVDQPQVSGEPASSSVYTRATGNVAVSIGGQPAPVDFAGLAPGYVGLYQVNVRVPTNIAAGNQPISISVGGKTSPVSVNGFPVTLPVR